MNKSNVLVIENHEEFEKFVIRLSEQVGGSCEYFYTDEEKMTLFRRMNIITSPFDLNISEREIQKKLYAYLIEELEIASLSEKLQSLHSDMIQCIEELRLCNDFELTYNDDFSLISILKNLGIGLEELEGDFCSKIISYGDIMHKLLARDVLVLCNCDAYLRESDYDNLEKWAEYNEITILYLRNVQNVWQKSNNEYIIDKDLCEIH